MKILLWDIDGTLIHSDRAGMYAWLQALEEEHGAPIEADGVRTAGLTDARIGQIAVQEILGRDPDEDLARRLLARYLELLPDWLLRRREGYVQPNVCEILDAADARGDIELALLTGNLEAGARLKLGHFGLWDRFCWGAYGDASPDRRELARLARRTAQSRHGKDGIEAIFVIGDTEHDIDCGRAIGARTIAVGTGPYPVEELARHDPWWAVASLPPAAEFLARIDG